MGRLKTSIAEAQVAEDMSQRLSGVVKQCKDNADGLVDKFQEAMKIDKIRSDRIQFIKDTIMDVIVAAAYALPGGQLVAGTLNLFRKRSLSAAMWLARSGDSELATVMWGSKANASNTVSSYSGGQFVNAQSQVANSSRFSDLSNDSTSLLGGDPAMRQLHINSLETQVGDSLSSVLQGMPGKESSALSRICFDSVEDASRGAINRDRHADGGASLMMASYKQALGQLQEVAYGGEAAILSYALAAIAEGMELEENGAQIARLGGFKLILPGGSRPRLALGEEEVNIAKNDFRQLNRLQQGWSDREWVGATEFEKAQRRLSPKVRDSYPGSDGWTPEQADKIIAFKACVTAYRSKLEKNLASLCVGSVSKFIIQDAVRNPKSELINQGGFDHKSTARHVYYDGDHGLLRSAVRFFSFGLAWSTTTDGDARASLMVDAYILHKVLELHLGTPWLAPLPNNAHTHKKVGVALLDAWNTIVLSKAQSRNEKKLTKHFPLMELFAGPLVASYWSPIGAFLAELPRKSDNNAQASKSESFQVFLQRPPSERPPTSGSYTQLPAHETC